MASWPPPGLESIQGALWQITTALMLGGLILILPLLYSVGTEQDYWRLGPFGSNWWALLATSGIGLVVLLSAFDRLFRVLRTGRRAAALGHGRLTMLHVVADSARDSGFLLQGLRHYRSLKIEERRRLLNTRAAGSLLYMAGALWILIGFALAAFLAARGLLRPLGVWVFTLLPAAAALLSGLLARVKESMWIRRARLQLPGVDQDETQAGVTGWISDYEAANVPNTLGRGVRSGPRPFVIGNVLVAVAGVILLWMIAAFVSVETVGPIATRIGMPRFQGVQSRAVKIDVLRKYRLPRDTSITPEDAGRAFHNLAMMGEQVGVGHTTYFQPPQTNYEEILDRTLGRYAVPLLYERAFIPERSEHYGALQESTNHPAHDEFRVLGRAQMADILGARLISPLPDTLTWYDLPIPRLTGITVAARAHLVKAAFQMEAGRIEEAEETIREVISAGILLYDEGPTLIDNLIGIVVAGSGETALDIFLRRTGRTDEADDLSWMVDQVESAAYMATLGMVDPGPEESLHYMARIPLVVNAMRGLRFEMFANFNTVAPCLNLNRFVFGPTDEFEWWVDQSRRLLVRWPSEEQYFEMARLGGLRSHQSQENPGFMARLLGWTFGNPEAAADFGSLLKSIR
jgi:hypothetical protein